ncbi:iron-siderophore ABC transporter substrate-binding protein [Cellulomonas sp. JH27-2]|uniref:iron-siderophore ABC transporter substrate-binding protein n=1 Tax=Cellulomonas sp. JH27-2 TaxID=2774139 RepID=UPI00177DA09A|nr:iron-siderophore ABC transporter substrate-binding protein [Cellulomonas sp. JH27-2]MBD8060232.1 iron-siderophore ABC transporter substrate-binding protein [Cellulomonas sp. JH27-2]
MRTALRPARLAALAAVAALALAACSSGDDDATPAATSSDTASAAADAFPVTLKNTFGETTIDKQPERVASIAWGNQDVAIALGIVPVGFAKANYGDDNGDGVLPWAYDALQKLGATGDKAPQLFDETDGTDFEAVNDTNPDVILAAQSGITKEDWTTLSAIAPTVSFPTVAWGTNWRDMALVDGEAIGKKAEAQAKIDEIEKQITSALATRPDIAGKTFVYTAADKADKSKLWIYTGVDARVQYVEDFGMKVAPSVAGFSELTGFGGYISSENADKLSDADILVTYGDDTTLAWLQKDPLLGKIPAVKNGAVVVVPDNTPFAASTSGPTILSVPWGLDKYLDLFEAAAKNVK